MRVFAALPLPRTAVDTLRGVIAQLRARIPRVRWVSESALHLTLHFFGEVAEGPLSDIYRVFEGSGLRRPAIDARLGPLGQFPPRGNPRVLWIGLEADAGRLDAYWQTFESAVAPLGWEPDRRGFAPHITIGRASAAPVEPAWAEGIEVPRVEFSLVECVLFQSILGRDGAQYVPLRRVALDGVAS